MTHQYTATAAQVSLDLDAIADMATRLAARALDRGSDRLMPGGEALAAIAPTAERWKWERRIELAEQAELRRRPGVRGLHDRPLVDLEHEDLDDHWPALTTLRYWSEGYRTALGMDNDDVPWWRPSLASEAAFLRNRDVAAWIHATEPESRYATYADDVAGVRTRLENVLSEGDRAERIAVTCDRCPDDRPLTRVYDKPRLAALTCAACGTTTPAVGPDAAGDHCPNPWCWTTSPPHEVLVSDPANDRWKCSGCKHRYTADDIPDLFARQLRRTGGRDYVTRPDALDILTGFGHQRRVAERLVDHDTTLGWCDTRTHTRHVYWPEVWRRHLTELHHRALRAQAAAARRGRSATQEANR